MSFSLVANKMVRLSLGSNRSDRDPDANSESVAMDFTDSGRVAARKESSPLLFDSQASNLSEGRALEGGSMYDPTVDDEFGRARTESVGITSADHKYTSNFQTMMHLLKSNLGTGILAMPKAFANAGLLVGTLGIPIMGLICIHCMHILVNCNKNLSKRIKARSLGYDKVVYYAFKMGPPRLQRYAAFAKGTVNFFLLLTQFGFCCVYYVFVVTSLTRFISNVAGYDPKHPPIGTIALTSILLPFMIGLNMIRSLRTLAFFSAFANVLQVVGLSIIFANLFQNIPPVSSRPLSVSISKLPLYFGTAIYAFEGIGVVLPLENEMETPEDFGGLNGVLNTGMVLVSALYTAMGFYGFLHYGENVESTITNTIPQTPVNEVCRFMFSLAIFLSYSIQLYVPVQIIFPYLKRKYYLDDKFTEKGIARLEWIFRGVCVCGTFLFAIAIPDLELFISLVGALASSSLALIIPPILESITYWDEPCSRTYWYWISTKNITICVFGIIGFVTGTYATLVKLINPEAAAEN